jgi:altronate hydrolase
LKTELDGVVEYRYEPDPEKEHAAPTGLTFDGYVRSDGTVGTRNEIWILPSVGCVNQNAETIARACNEQFGERFDGVYAFPHPHGCSQVGEDLDDTRRVLAGLIRNPNAGGVLLLGLGCEENQVESVLTAVGDVDRMRIRHFNSQDVEEEVEHGIEAVRELAHIVEHDRRAECPVSDLVVGLECGGSDALSGVTANPLVGRVSDRIVTEGGSVMLAEVPEMFGAEQTLMNRAANREVFAEIVCLINDYKRYLTARDCPIYENPSPGNVEGGLTTLEEKSLGAIRKGGTSKVNGVVRYGDRVFDSGLALLNTPGNDAVSSTALVAAGATVLLFTTGRGTPLGSPVPTIKISTNTSISERKPRWIDFNAGTIADGTASIEELESGLVELLLGVASGRIQASNERSNQRGIAIWKTGATL